MYKLIVTFLGEKVLNRKICKSLFEFYIPIRSELASIITKISYITFLCSFLYASLLIIRYICVYEKVTYDAPDFISLILALPI